MKHDLISMLKEPKYIECFMVKTPMVKLRKNHKTQILFVTLYLLVIFAQIFIIVPSKFYRPLTTLDQKFKFFAFAITGLSIVLAIAFTVASCKDPGILRPEH